MSFPFLKLARKVLSEEKRPLTVNEIWEISARQGYEKELESKEVRREMYDAVTERDQLIASISNKL